MVVEGDGREGVASCGNGGRGIYKGLAVYVECEGWTGGQLLWTWTVRG